MIHYIIQTIAFQLFFLLIYDLFLKRETFFNWNRLYLIGTMLLSILLPFIQIESFKEVIPPEYVIQLPAVIIGDVSQSVSEGVNQFNTVSVSSPMSYVYLLFYVGFAIAIFMFGFKLFKVLKLIVNNPKTSSSKLVIVKLLNSNSAFSFFKYVFLGEFLKDDEKALILSHEEVHVKQYHSLDLLFFEGLRVVFWFNPLVYMYQNRITELHEFLADAEAVKNQSKQHYYQNLLAQVFQTKSISFINPFFNQSLIKKRIIMLQKSKSKHIKLLKYAFLIPAVIAMLVYTSCEKQVQNNEEAIEESITSNKNEGRKQFMVDGKKVSEEEFQNITLKGVDAIHYDAKNNTVKAWTENKELKLKEQNIEVPFAHVEHVPVFPGCEFLETNEERKNCMAEKITQFIGEHFNTDLANSLGLEGKQRINVMFKINEEGNVVDVRANAPHPGLEEEAKRVVELLPKMQPGKQKGHLVSVPYTLPIIFQVEDKE